MQPFETLAYLLVVAYTAGFLLLSARRAGRPIWLFGKGAEPQALPALLFRIAFACALLWPLVRATFGNPLGHDPLATALDRPALHIAGLALIVIGAGLAIWLQWHISASRRIGALAATLIRGWWRVNGPGRPVETPRHRRKRTFP